MYVFQLTIRIDEMENKKQIKCLWVGKEEVCSGALSKKKSLPKCTHARVYKLSCGT